MRKVTHLCQEIVERELGFATANILEICNFNSEASSHAREQQAVGGWIDAEDSQSSYSPLFDRWIYMFGDSTIRQLFGCMAAITMKDNRMNIYHKLWTRQHCNHQHNRTEDFKSGCSINEVTCSVVGFGKSGRVTFDWKHFPYEHYDDYIWGEEGPFWKASERRPDILVVQTGIHACTHTNPDSVHGKHLTEVNETELGLHHTNIDKLFQTIRTTIEASREEDNRTKHVIVMTSGLVYDGLQTDNCIVRFNRLQAAAARRQGFAVLDRAELHSRALFKSHLVDVPWRLFKPEVHLEFPIPQTITTVLVKMLHCLREIDMSQPLPND